MAHLLVKILFLLFIMSYNIQSIEVHIHNNLPENSPQVEVHCASGDDDLGYHYPKVGTEFNWSFNMGIFTLFFCHFWWNGKDKAFDVFNNVNYCVDDVFDDVVPQGTYDCHWQVQDDGFYLGYLDEGQLHLTKIHDW
ncbi:hypothetical protein P3S67_002102 [Capsicum chacoense]